MRLYAGDMNLNRKDEKKYVEIQTFNFLERGGRVVRWCWVNFQCRGVMQFGLL